MSGHPRQINHHIARSFARKPRLAIAGQLTNHLYLDISARRNQEENIRGGFLNMLFPPHGVCRRGRVRVPRRSSHGRIKGVSNKKALHDICIALPMSYNRRFWIGINDAYLFAAADAAELKR
jgi:hypothetical protein